MSESAELIWIRGSGGIRTVVLASKSARKTIDKHVSMVHCSNLRFPLVTKLPAGKVIYRHPTRLQVRDDAVHAGPVFAILAGNRHFSGSRADFRDVLHTAHSEATFVYVLPTECVSDAKSWTGYVRIGYKNWIPIPCPRPEAIYNRIPNRVLEVNQYARRAKAQITSLRIPMFNPGYFSKADIYHVLREAGLGHFLPRTLDVMTWPGFTAMLREAGGVYLKPTGSSIGHGIMRVDKEGRGYRVRVLKNLTNNEYQAMSANEAWRLVQQHRIRGKYVIQHAIPLVEWDGKPCDLRVLLQKHGSKWSVVGKGVRVAGAKSITTHVPTGGSIVELQKLLGRAFPETSQEVEERVEELALACANAIDAHFQGRLGEMSMDVGVDKQGHVWLFEANSKPMKFDEPHIRERSLKGVIRRLSELRRTPVIR